MSILYRSAVSLGANLAKAVLSFSTGILLARGLGPEEYGVFAFLLAGFTALRSLLDMGSSSAFFNFIAKRNRSARFVGYYLLWILFQFIVSFLFIAVIAPDEWVQRIWEGESRARVLTAFVAVFLQQQVWNMVAVLGESQRLTVRLQALNLSIGMVHLIFVGTLFWVEELTIERIYWLISIEFAIATLTAKWVFPLVFTNERDKPRDIFREYFSYCLPLIPYAWMGMVMGYADTWLLQHYGGAVEQAYYSVAVQFSAISNIATASVLRILWKEVAEANHQGDLGRVRHLYERTNRTLFIVGAMISGFLIPWSEEIIGLTLGEAYIEGAFVMALMFIYPIHQSLGQVNGTMYYALDLVRPYVVIGMIQMLLSTIAVYFMLAPKDAIIPGLGLASIGLALKMLVMQFIVVNFLIWWLARHQDWRFGMGYQLIGISLFLMAGFVVYHFVWMIADSDTHFFVLAVLAGAIYVLFTMIIIYSMPWLAGVSRDELHGYISRLLRKRYSAV